MYIASPLLIWQHPPNGIQHWKADVILIKLLPLAAPEIVILATSGATSDEN